MLSIADVAVAIESVDILRGVSLQLEQGTISGLIGRNGAGKTTLMRSVMGILTWKSGTVHFEKRDLAALPTYARSRLGIGYMPEDRRLVPALSVEENVLLPLWALGAKDSVERLQQIYTLIPEVSQQRGRKALQLSGGQQKLVALARALMNGTRLLLLDEPFEGVAPVLAQRLVEVIAGLKRAGLTVLLSESDLHHSAGMLDRVFRIDRGVVQRER
jgi:branched-chain amino acid transport system ATP-binding protein